MTRNAENAAPRQVVHEPRCNTYCDPGRHYLTDGVGFPHIHRTDMDDQCGECVTPPKATAP